MGRIFEQAPVVGDYLRRASATRYNAVEPIADLIRRALAFQGLSSDTLVVVIERASVLELGCGSGRVTHALAALGHQLVAVDESRDMLAGLRLGDSAPRIMAIHSKIEELRLESRFDVVVLASQLVNTIDSTVRRQMLDTCRRHVRDGGCVILQRHDPSFLTEPIDRRRGDARFTCATSIGILAMS